jgi:hypothetical protein
MTVRVFVDDNFHYMDESERYELGTFDTVDEALSTCRAMVDADLADMAKPGLSAQQLYSFYTHMGRDPFIVGADDKVVPWSAWDYAKLRCNDLVLPGDLLKQAISLGSQMASSEARRMLALKTQQVLSLPMVEAPSIAAGGGIHE